MGVGKAARGLWWGGEWGYSAWEALRGLGLPVRKEKDGTHYETKGINEMIITRLR